MRGYSGTIIVQHASQQSHPGWLSVGFSPPSPRPYSLPEVHQNAHEVFVRFERRVGTFINAAEKILNGSGASSHPGRMPCSTANRPPLILCVSHISTVLHCIPIVGMGKERRTSNRPMVKPEKAAHVPVTALGNTCPVPRTLGNEHLRGNREESLD